MKYIIVVDKQTRTNPSSEKREYEINIDELRRKGEVHDDLKIEQGIAKVYRRIGLTKTHMTYILDEKIIEELGELKIKLFEGDNYIYIKDEYNNQMCTEYIVKSDFTDMFVTKLEMSSAIDQTAESINLSVNKKLEEYSNKEEMKALIKVEAEGITSEVSKQYATKDEMSSSITQTANEIKSIVSVSIGTVNLVLNSDFSHMNDEHSGNGIYDLKHWNFGGSYSENTGVVLVEDKTWLRIYKDDIGTVNLSQTLKPVKIDEDYTLSFKLKNNSLQTGKERNTSIRFNVYFYSSNNEVIDSSLNNFTIANNMNEQTFNCTFHTPNNENLNYIDFKVQVYNTFASDDVTSKVFDSSITNIQLEIGQIATEWRASQTDYYNKIEQYSKVVQTVDEVSTELSKKVGNDEIISKINQSAESVTINANKISLERKRNKLNK